MKMHKLLIAAIFVLLMGANAALAGGDAAAGETKSASCAGCHGGSGEGMGENPKIAGMAEADFVAAMQAYKSGERENAMMQMFAGQLSDQDMADLAAFFAGKGGE